MRANGGFGFGNGRFNFFGGKLLLALALFGSTLFAGGAGAGFLRFGLR